MGKLPLSPLGKKKRHRCRKQKIIVLGAGVSGLACSQELRQRGYDVLVVEARSRVGGRLKGEMLELGADYPPSIVQTPPKMAAPSSSKTTPTTSDSRQGQEQRKTGNNEQKNHVNSTVSVTRQHPVDVGGEHKCFDQEECLRECVNCLILCLNIWLSNSCIVPS